jgi:pimeloyl-ACP methyl ester carboxylesterase
MAHTRSEPKLAYSLSGPDKAPMVVFVNGLGGAQAAFMLQTRDFSKDHRVLTFDHRGIGQSDIVDQSVHMADYASDLVRILDEIGEDRVDLVGLSFGGRVLLQLAAGWPERVRRMVLSGTSAGGQFHEPGNVNAHSILRTAGQASVDVWAEKIAPLLFGRRYVEQYPERLQSLARWRARYPTNPVAIARQWEAWESFDVGDQLSDIQAPVLVLHGTDDALSPVANAEMLVGLLPHAYLQLMDGIGHSPNVEAPDRFNHAIRNFLKRT